MSHGPGTRLSVVSGQARLPRTTPIAVNGVPIALPGSDDFILMLNAEAPSSIPRTIVLSASSPIDAFLMFTGSNGFGGRALITLTQYARVTVDARTLKVWAYNRTSVDNNAAFVSVGDGAIMTTRNAWVAEWWQASPPAAGSVTVPPFAEGLRAASSLGAASVAAVNYFNGMGGQVGSTPVVETATRPAVIAGAVTVTVTGLVAGEVVTLNFDLGL